MAVLLLVSTITFTVVSLEQWKQPSSNSLSGRTTSNGAHLMKCHINITVNIKSYCKLLKAKLTLNNDQQQQQQCSTRNVKHIKP